MSSEDRVRRDGRTLGVVGVSSAVLTMTETQNDSDVVVFSRLSSQVNKLKRDLACMKQELQYKEQGFETLKE